MLTPKLLFQKLHKESARTLALSVEEVWFQQAMTFAQAELTSKGLSKEQMEGANEFIKTFSQLHLEHTPPAMMPDKSALATYDTPVAEAAKEEEAK